MSESISTPTRGRGEGLTMVESEEIAAAFQQRFLLVGEGRKAFPTSLPHHLRLSRGPTDTGTQEGEVDSTAIFRTIADPASHASRELRGVNANYTPLHYCTLHYIRCNSPNVKVRPAASKKPTKWTRRPISYCFKDWK